MYLADTNFLGTLATDYPTDVFPSLWSNLSIPLFSADVYFHEEVDKEMAKWAHPQHTWYSSHVNQSHILTPDQAELDCYEEVTEWVTNSREPSYKTSAVDEFLLVADSWLVASAYRHGAIIVTNEVPAPQSKKRVKIPDVADHFSVPCISALDFLRALKIKI